MSERANNPLTQSLDEAVRHLNSGNWPLARRCLERVLQEEASHPVATYLQGVCELRQGHWHQAEQLLRRALTVSAPPQVSVDLAHALAAQGRGVEALECLQQALARVPADFGVRLALAQAQEAAGLLEEAIAGYRALLAARHGSAEPWLRLAALLTRMVRAQEAEQLLQGAPLHQFSPAERAAWSHQMGRALKHQRKHAQSLRHLEDARAAAPQDRQILMDLAVLLQHLRRYEDAAALLEERLGQEPLDLDAHLQLNELLHRQGRDDAFLTSYERAVARTPKAASLLSAKGRLLLRAGRAAEAMDAFERALALEPAHPAAMAGRARALEALGDPDGARRAHEAGVVAHPSNADVLIDAAAFLLRQQEPGRAKQLVLEALSARPTDQAALSLLILCHRALREERAESWLAGYEKLIGVYDLPPPEGYATMLDFNRDLAAYLDPLHDDKREHLTQTVRGGTRLHDEVFGNGHELVERLRRRIDEAVAHYIAHLPSDGRHPFTGRRSAGFLYVSSWSSRLSDRGFHLNHVHTQGWISSAYYVAVPEVCGDSLHPQGWLKFGEPSEDFGDRFPARRLVQPMPGRLVLFPSYLWHGTVPFESPQPRMTIAFDVAPLGKPLV
ncbi:MAG TPA: tetratricopeptide repeat protein [Steroidobacteraceae bacterium]|nr:tetratricopeptide repeat protein [Steroidobacteraceae bacterium]